MSSFPEAGPPFNLGKLDGPRVAIFVKVIGAQEHYRDAGAINPTEDGWRESISRCKCTLVPEDHETQIDAYRLQPHIQLLAHNGVEVMVCIADEDHVAIERRLFT